MTAVAYVARCTRPRWLVAIGMLAFLPALAWTQEVPAAPLALELPQGVKVEVHAPSELQGEALADLLEDYARRLRARAAESAPPPTNAELAAQTVSLPGAVTGATGVTPAAPQHPDLGEADHGTVFSWCPNRRWTFLPNTLLWQPPLANPNEPRSYIKAMSLSNDLFSSANDFNLGATFALFRNSPVDQPDAGWQLDLFAMALSRFAERNFAAAVDYRFGIPITFAWGNWSAKLAYEHTSTHLGDEFMVNTGAVPRDGIREEITFGLAYRPLDALRLYGVFGYALHVSTFTDHPQPERYSFGAEWSQPAPTGWRGQPFAALDVEFRGDAEFTPNVTAQVGWQWLAEHGRPGLRLALEYYDGRSPFGQFLDRHESWFGFGIFFDY